MNRTAFQRVLSFMLDRTRVRLGVALALLALATPFHLAAQNQNDGRRSPVGTWNFHAVLDCGGTNQVPCPFPTNEFIGVETFNTDGTMQVVANIPDVTIGAGVWKRTGPGRYTFTFTFFRPRLPIEPPGLMVPVFVNENLRMIDENSYITRDIIRVVDVEGNTLFEVPGTVTATRYPFLSYNELLP